MVCGDGGELATGGEDTGGDCAAVGGDDVSGRISEGGDLEGDHLCGIAPWDPMFGIGVAAAKETNGLMPGLDVTLGCAG